jgi:hypothetical protein
MCEAGLSTRDIAQALNCSQQVIELFLIQKRLGYFRREEFPVGNSVALWDTRGLSRNARGLVLYQPPRTPEAVSRHREILASHLSREVRNWVHAIELTDADGQVVINRARLLLNDSPLNRERTHTFDVDRTVAELRQIWLPQGSDNSLPDFNSLLGRWLASWIRFWVSQPLIWSRALDLELRHIESLRNVA